MIYIKSNKIARKECKLEPPPTRWSKLKFGMPSRGNLGPTCFICIIYSNKKSCLTKHAKPLGVMSNKLIEFKSLIEGLILSKEIGMNKLVIKGYSQIILNTLRKKETLIQILNSKLEQSLAIIYQLEETIIKHIRRECNREANGLTNKGAYGENILIRQANMKSISQILFLGAKLV